MSTVTPNATLMVPIAVEALVMNPYVRKNWTATLWRRFLPDWQDFATSGSPPYGSNSYYELSTADDGVYIHWVLPDALTKATVPKTTSGTQNSISFPFAPNRWIVVRVGPAANASRPLTAWVIQSDYLVSYPTPAIPAARQGTSPYVHPFTSVAGSLKPATIGTSTRIDKYTGELPSEGTQLFLTAAGPGDVSFAAYQPGVNDVFALFDSDIANAAPGAFDYLVAGWYSNPSGDPLTPLNVQDDWSSILTRLKWTVIDGPNAPGRATPSSASSTMCHGVVLGVNWLGTNQATGPVSSGPADPTALNVTIGSATMDALCTEIQRYADAGGGNQGTTYERHLQGLMTGMLPSVGTPDGAVRVRESVERGRFGSAYGGTRWAVVPATLAGMPAPSGPVTLTPAQQTALDTLNALQVQRDAFTRSLSAAQWKLYTLWWKNMQAQNFLNPYQPPESISSSQWGQPGAANDPSTVLGYLTAQLANAPGTAFDNVNQLQQVLARFAGLPDPQTPASIAKYAQNIMGLGASLTLKAVPLPRYYQPLDPVVLVHGMPPAAKYGANNSYSNKNLLCRFDAQVAAGINYKEQIAINAAQLGGMIQVPSTTYLPPGVVALVQALCREMFLVNPANAPLIAAQIGPTVDSATLASQMQSRTFLLGTSPADIAVAQWKQPFSPLYLEWAVEFVPTPVDQVNNWVFDGKDYVFTGTVHGEYYNAYMGRSLLTPHAADTFRLRVKQYMKDAGAKADNALGHVSKLLSEPSSLDSPDMLSQSLSGLNSMLLLLDPSPNYPPDASVASLVDYQFHAVPYTRMVADIDMRPPPPPAPMPRFFFPVRSGFFRFSRLDLVDTFGQTVDLLAANGNQTGVEANPDYFNPIVAPELALDPTTTILNRGLAGNWMRLAPRLPQPARLDVTLLPAVAGATPDSNPVHGWLVPNHLDQSISVYDADGVLLGEVMAVLDPKSGGATTTVWVPAPPAPGGAASPATVDKVSDAQLRGAVQGLITASADGSAFQTFVDVVDETLWTIDPIGGRADQNLTVLMGRPLAIVQVQVTIEPEGEPAANQSFAATSAVAQGLPLDTADLLTHEFSVQLGDMARGDDGVMGYFTSDFTGFNSIVDPASLDAEGGASSYVRVIGANGNYLSVGVGTASSVTVTALVDPRGNIHATSGIQPVSETTIPAQYVTGPEAAMMLTFRTGPLLTDPATVRVPRPAENNGQWGWISYQAGATPGAPASYTYGPLVPASATARLGDPPGLSEGWLQFAPTDAGK